MGCSSSFIARVDHFLITAWLSDSLELGDVGAVGALREGRSVQILGVYGVVSQSSAVGAPATELVVAESHCSSHCLSGLNFYA